MSDPYETEAQRIAADEGVSIHTARVRARQRDTGDAPTEQIEHFASLPAPEDVSPFQKLPFEAAVIREAAFACQMARLHDCTISVQIGGKGWYRWRVRPVTVTITPTGAETGG